MLLIQARCGDSQHWHSVRGVLSFSFSHTLLLCLSLVEEINNLKDSSQIRKQDGTLKTYLGDRIYKILEILIKFQEKGGFFDL